MTWHTIFFLWWLLLSYHYNHRYILNKLPRSWSLSEPARTCQIFNQRASQPREWTFVVAGKLPKKELAMSGAFRKMGMSIPVNPRKMSIDIVSIPSKSRKIHPWSNTEPSLLAVGQIWLFVRRMATCIFVPLPSCPIPCAWCQIKSGASAVYFGRYTAIAGHRIYSVCEPSSQPVALG